MKINTLLTVGLSLLIATSAASAGQISKTYNFKNTGVDEEYVYCKVTDAKDSDSVEFKNRAEMIRGFDKHGHLTIAVDKVNGFYFIAKRDIKHYPFEKGSLKYTLTTDQNNADINCYAGQGEDRSPLTGGWGMSSQ